eukprot:382647-Rhodomonas_salina.1
MAYLLAYWKALLFPQVKDALFNTSLTLSAARYPPPSPVSSYSQSRTEVGYTHSSTKVGYLPTRGPPGTDILHGATSDDPPTIRLNRGTRSAAATRMHPAILVLTQMYGSTSPPANRKKERTLLYQMMEVVERKGFTLRDVGGPGTFLHPLRVPL